MKILEIKINTRTGQIEGRSLYEEHIRPDHIEMMTKLWGPSLTMIFQGEHAHDHEHEHEHEEV